MFKVIVRAENMELLMKFSLKFKDNHIFFIHKIFDVMKFSSVNLISV
jgi:hypothetical protein